MDRHYLPGKILKEYYGYGDNEGVLSTLPAVATALLWRAGGAGLRSGASPGTKGGRPCGGGGGVSGGSAVAVAVAFPVIKILWTSSYVLVAGGWSLLLLALFYGGH